MIFEKYKDYMYQAISYHAETNDMALEDHGEKFIGEQFIIIRDRTGKIISFVMTGYSGTHGSIFTCIYTDYESKKV